MLDKYITKFVKAELKEKKVQYELPLAASGSGNGSKRGNIFNWDIQRLVANPLYSEA